ncbi:hypothetical protein HanLR1_Chr07g0238731 [Helianthus annuus]|nr:hypothetical protein HanLR1_Chr07g0238731 [Helianthus annuus]
MLSLPTTQELYEELLAVLLVSVANKGLMALRMMMRWKAGSKLKLVCMEKGAFVRLWRMFAPDSEAKITTKRCGDDDEGWYETIVGNFRIPKRVALEALLPTGPGSLAALGVHTVAAGGSKGAHAAAAGGSKTSKAKRQENPVSLVVKQAGSGTFRPRKTQAEDYVLVFHTLEGLDMLGVTFGASDTGASTELLVGQKRKVETAPAGAAPKKPSIRRQKVTKLGAHIVQPASVVTTAPLPPPPSSPCKPTGDEKKVEEPERVVQVESNEETVPTHEARGSSLNRLVERYDDILDYSNNVIDPTANRGSAEGEGA